MLYNGGKEIRVRKFSDTYIHNDQEVFDRIHAILADDVCLEIRKLIYTNDMKHHHTSLMKNNDNGSTADAPYKNYGNLMQHAYHERVLDSTLRGSDAVFYQALKQTGLYDFFFYPLIINESGEDDNLDYDSVLVFPLCINNATVN